MQEGPKIIVRVVAVVTAAAGLFVIIRECSTYAHLVSTVGEAVRLVGRLIGTLGITISVLPFVKLVAAVGLFRIRKWAWVLAIVALTLDMLLRIVGAIRHSLESPQDLPELALCSGVVVEEISLWPSYVIALVSAVSLLVLANSRIRSQFWRREQIA